MADGSLVTISTDHVIRSTRRRRRRGVTSGHPCRTTPTAVAYAAGEQAFYVARFDCGFTEGNPVKPDSILRLPAATS